VSDRFRVPAAQSLTLLHSFPGAERPSGNGLRRGGDFGHFRAALRGLLTRY